MSHDGHEYGKIPRALEPFLLYSERLDEKHGERCMACIFLEWAVVKIPRDASSVVMFFFSQLTSTSVPFIPSPCGKHRIA